MLKMNSRTVLYTKRNVYTRKQIVVSNMNSVTSSRIRKMFQKGKLILSEKKKERNENLIVSVLI